MTLAKDQRMTNTQHTDADDHSLVLRVQNGEAPVFSELVVRHQSYCLRLATSVLHELEEAEDEVQNAFWNAYKHIHQFRFDAKFASGFLQ